MLPPMLLIGAPAEPPPTPEISAPPVETLMPPLAIEPELPAAAETTAPAVPPLAAGGLPPALGGRPPPPLVATSSGVPPELQATKKTKGATERSWDRGFDQE